MRVGAAPVVVVQDPPFRIRYLLGVSIVVLAGWSALPRVRAAWELQSAAAAFANYALCMVGPTGPSLLRDNPAEFRKLARRRLITAGPQDRPFVKCGKAAGEAASPEVARAHEATAWDFAEYGGDAADDRGKPRRLDDLAVTTERLADLTERAWPFVRGGYTALVQPSAYAAEAPHPVELPHPGLARGAVPERPLLAGGKCAAASGGTLSLGLSSDRKFHVVRSVSPQGIESRAAFAPEGARVVAAACDADGAVVAVGRPGTRDVALVSCAYLGECVKVPLPGFGKGHDVRFPLDVARVSGVTAVSTVMHGIVRVASTRDDGRSWTPFTVACDGAPPGSPCPDKLAALGNRIVLSGAPLPGGVFAALVSDDAGASFRAP